MTWEMIGHDWAVQLLRRNVAGANVRHAYLFVGPDGVGKRTLALRFAQALCCEAPPAAGEICGTCRACRLMGEQAHPDLHCVASNELGAALRVDQVRELQRKLALAPYEAKWRVALMIRFHEATPGASNALLKTLEEPAQKVVLLLTARTAEELPPTIVSRCAVLRLRCLPVDELEEALRNRGQTDEQAKFLAAVAAGRPGWALRVAEDSDWLRRRKQRLDELTGLLSMTRAQRFARAAALAKEGPSLFQLLETWLALWRDAALMDLGAEISMGNPDRISDLDRIRAQVGREGVLDALHATVRTLDAIDRNANPRLALETLMLDLPKL